jgi:hypothetical protein
MKCPKQLPAVERPARSSTSFIAATAGVRPSTLIGKQPSPACRLLSEYGCK